MSCHCTLRAGRAGPFVWRDARCGALHTAHAPLRHRRPQTEKNANKRATRRKRGIAYVLQRRGTLTLELEQACEAS